MANRRKEVSEMTYIGMALAVVMTLAAGATYIQAKAEADAYHRVTGRRVSVWDAMVLELRVDAAPKE